MLKFILRRTVYKEFSKESQDMLFSLLAKQHINKLFCSFMEFIMLFFPLLPCFTASFCEKTISTETRIFFIAYIIAYVVFMGCFGLLFNEAIKEFYNKVVEKLYFYWYTKKGKCFSSEDFTNLYMKNTDVYSLIASEKCRGRCYYVCFQILKTLQEGSIKIIAVKNINSKDENGYCLHVLYVKNGWAFDTYSQRQFKLEKILKIYHAKEFKDIYFDDIRHYSFDSFLYMEGKMIKKWCEENNITHKLGSY